MPSDWQRQFAAQLDALEMPDDAGMQVYHHNVRAQFRKALLASFPMTAELLGAARFDLLAERYRQRNPSRSGDLHPSGAAFSAFLDRPDTPTRDVSTSDSWPVDLAELASLEWAWQGALIAADEPSINATALARWQPEDWPALTLRLQPSFQVLRFRSAVLTHWQTRHPSSTTIEASRPASLADPRLAWLAGTPQGPILQACDAATADWLEAIVAGQTLAGALDRLDGAEVEVLATLRTLFGQGVVTAVDLRAN